MNQGNLEVYILLLSNYAFLYAKKKEEQGRAAAQYIHIIGQ